MQIIMYSPLFWNQLENRRDLLDQSKVQNLDMTMVLEDQHNQYDRVGDVINSSKETQIVNNLIKGWEEGQYAVGNLKAAIDRLTKQIFTKFCEDCRKFCHKTIKKEIENPSLGNLLQEMSIAFCSKIFLYCFYVFKPIVLKMFSIVRKCMNQLLLIASNNHYDKKTLKISEQKNEQNNCQIKEQIQRKAQLTISQKQKLTILVDGLLSVAIFTFRICYDRCLQLFQQKTLSESIDTSDLKALLNILESESNFLKAYIGPLISVSTQSFLSAKIISHQERMPLSILSERIHLKLSQFLQKSHKYSLQVQLKESLQNQEWVPTDIPTFYYDSLHFLLTAQNLRRRQKTIQSTDTSVLISRLSAETSYLQAVHQNEFRIVRNQIIIEQHVYKVTPSILLIVQLLQDYFYLQQSYPIIQGQVLQIVEALLLYYNQRAYNLIVMAGAVGLGKIKTKNITAKHLALSSLSLCFLKCILTQIEKKFNVQFKGSIIKEITAHEDSIYIKLNHILVSKINQSLGDVGVNTTPSKGTESIVSNTKILHDILKEFYQPHILGKIFTKDCIISYLNKLQSLQIKSKNHVQALKDQIEFYFDQLKFLQGFIKEYSFLKIDAEGIVKKAYQKL